MKTGSNRHRRQAQCMVTLLNALLSQAGHRIGYSGHHPRYHWRNHEHQRLLVFVLSIPPASDMPGWNWKDRHWKVDGKNIQGRSRFICGRCYHQSPADLAEDLKIPRGTEQFLFCSTRWTSIPYVDASIPWMGWMVRTSSLPQPSIRWTSIPPRHACTKRW